MPQRDRDDADDNAPRRARREGGPRRGGPGGTQPEARGQGKPRRGGPGGTQPEARGQGKPRRGGPGGTQPEARGQGKPRRGGPGGTQPEARGQGKPRRAAPEPRRGGAPNSERGSARAGRPDRKESPGDRRTTSDGDGGLRRSPEPALPEDASAALLDRSVRDAVAALGGPLAASVGKHLAAVGLLLDEDPEAALAHAMFVKDRAPRLPAAREALGIAAYAAGRYDLARSELRAARRMAGVADLLPMLADCERGLGNPGRALEVAASADAARLDEAGRLELALVVAGARRDLRQFDAALAALELPALRSSSTAESALRLRYAYADTLSAAGRTGEARAWFARVAAQDEEGVTDAADRVATGAE